MFSLLHVLGLTVAANYYIHGTREGSAVLYKHDSYPRQALGPCKFMWKPSVLKSGDNKETCPKRCLWFWFHPALYKDIFEELTNVFDASPVKKVDEQMKCLSNECQTSKTSSSTDESIVEEKGKESSKSEEKPMDKIEKSMLENPIYVGVDVTIRSLKDTLCRFHLAGPLSQSILAHLLCPADIKGGKKGQEGDTVREDWDLGCEEPDAESQSDPIENKWWDEYYADETLADVHASQSSTWRTVSGQTSPSNITPHAILGLTVKDPRVALPLQRNKVLPQVTGKAFTSTYMILLVLHHYIVFNCLIQEIDKLKLDHNVLVFKSCTNNDL